MVALLDRLDAFLAVGAAELVQVTRRDVAGQQRTVLFVALVATVEETVAFLARFHADAARTLEVARVTRPVICQPKKNKNKFNCFIE